MLSSQARRRIAMISVAVVALVVLIGAAGLAGMMMAPDAPKAAEGDDEAAAADNGAEADVDEDRTLRHRLTKAIADVLRRVSGIEEAEREEAFRNLREADRILTQTKEQNRRALRSISGEGRRRPKPPAKGEKEKEAEDRPAEVEPEAARTASAVLRAGTAEDAESKQAEEAEPSDNDDPAPEKAAAEQP
jgi:hypothetical protein